MALYRRKWSIKPATPSLREEEALTILAVSAIAWYLMHLFGWTIDHWQFYALVLPYGLLAAWAFYHRGSMLIPFTEREVVAVVAASAVAFCPLYLLGWTVNHWQFYALVLPLGLLVSYLFYRRRRHSIHQKRGVAKRLK